MGAAEGCYGGVVPRGDGPRRTLPLPSPALPSLTQQATAASPHRIPSRLANDEAAAR